MKIWLKKCYKKEIDFLKNMKISLIKIWKKHNYFGLINFHYFQNIDKELSIDLMERKFLVMLK